MSEQYAIVPFMTQAVGKRLAQTYEPWAQAQQWGTRLLRFLSPLGEELHRSRDIRPIRTLAQASEAIIAFRNSTRGLLLSELGEHLDTLGGTGGGTKRLGTLIRHRDWRASQIDEYVWQRADAHLRKARTAFCSLAPGPLPTLARFSPWFVRRGRLAL